MHAELQDIESSFLSFTSIDLCCLCWMIQKKMGFKRLSECRTHDTIGLQFHLLFSCLFRSASDYTPLLDNSSSDIPFMKTKSFARDPLTLQAQLIGTHYLMKSVTVFPPAFKTALQTHLFKSAYSWENKV